MPNFDFTLEDINSLFERKLAKEREHTRQIVRDEVQQSERRIIAEVTAEVTAEFSSFIEYNFEPAISSLQTQIDEIKTDVQDIKRQLRGPHLV